MRFQPWAGDVTPAVPGEQALPPLGIGVGVEPVAGSCPIARDFGPVPYGFLRDFIEHTGRIEQDLPLRGAYLQRARPGAVHHLIDRAFRMF